MYTGKNMGKTDLGECEETFGERDDVLHLSHCVDTVLHGLCVLDPRTVKNTLDARNVVFGPLLVRQADSLQKKLAPRAIVIGYSFFFFFTKTARGTQEKKNSTGKNRRTLAIYPKRIK